MVCPIPVSRYSNLTNPPGYFPHDFGKPNDTQALYQNEMASAVSFWRTRDVTTTTTTFLVESNFTDP